MTAAIGTNNIVVGYGFLQSIGDVPNVAGGDSCNDGGSDFFLSIMVLRRHRSVDHN